MFFGFKSLSDLKKVFSPQGKDKTSWGNGIVITADELISEQKNSIGLLTVGRHKVKSVGAGNFRSPFKGRGMEFDEVREYKPGDDTRTIDWKVTAKLGKPFTKLFHEERERPVFLLVDMRTSMRFGTKVAFKSVIAARIAAMISWSATESGDKVGGIVISASKHFRLAPHRQRRRMLGFLNAIADASTDSSQKVPPPLSEALGEMRRVCHLGGIVFIISDFVDFNEEAQKQLSLIASHSDVVCVYVADRLEEEPPPAGVYRVSDAFGNSTVINASDKSWRDAYVKLFAQRREKIESFCIKRGLFFVPVYTDDDIAGSIKDGMRRKRRKVNVDSPA